MKLFAYFFARRGSLFGREHSGTLSLFRVLYCLFVAIEIIDSIGLDDEAYASGKRYDAVPLLSLVSSEALPYTWFRVLRAALLVALFLSACGVLTRPALWFSFVGFVVFEGTTLGFSKPLSGDYVYHMSNLTVFALGLLAIAPGVDRHGITSFLRGRSVVEPIPEWPRKTVLGLLALAYIGASYCRMANDPGWLDGYTLQGYLFERALKHGVDGAFELAQSRAMCLWFGIATMLFETTFCLVLVFPRLGFLYAVAGLLLHASIKHLMDVDFFEFFILNYFAMLEWPAIARFFTSKSKVDPDEIITGGISVFQRRFCIGILIAQAVCIVGRIEKWPLSDFAVYSKRRHPDDVRVLVLARRLSHDRVRPFPVKVQSLFRREALRSGLGKITLRVAASTGVQRQNARNDARRISYHAIEEIRPLILRQEEGVALFVKRVRKDTETDRYKIVMDLICDITPPRNTAKSGDSGESEEH